MVSQTAGMPVAASVTTTLYPVIGAGLIGAVHETFALVPAFEFAPETSVIVSAVGAPDVAGSAKVVDAAVELPSAPLTTTLNV